MVVFAIMDCFHGMLQFEQLCLDRSDYALNQAHMQF